MSVDCQVGLTSKQQKSNDVIKLSKYHNVLTPPTYFVSLDVMKVNSHSYESLGAKKNGQCWWKVFSISLALSSFLQNNFFADRSCLRGCDGRIEVYGSWNRQASYFQSKNGIMVCISYTTLFLHYEDTATYSHALEYLRGCQA